MIQTGVIQGLDKAIARYEKKGTNFFALYCGNDKLPVVNGLNGRWEEMSECVEELREYFEDITPDHKKVYSIVYYEGPVKADSKGKISDLPEGSVKFITSNPEQIQSYITDATQRRQEYVGSVNNEILSKLSANTEAMNALVAKISEETEEDEPEQTQNVLAGLIQDPNVINFFVGTVHTIIDRILPPKQHIAGIAGTETVTKLDQALEILRQHDEQLEEDLMILAQMAQDNPFQFKMLL
jgi:hypothetical protein